MTRSSLYYTMVGQEVQGLGERNSPRRLRSSYTSSNEGTVGCGRWDAVGSVVGNAETLSYGGGYFPGLSVRESWSHNLKSVVMLEITAVAVDWESSAALLGSVGAQRVSEHQGSSHL